MTPEPPRMPFDETILGLYNAAKHGLRIEIRVDLHKQTLPRLRNLAEFIYRNLPFVNHIALMGLGNMGYVKANWSLLWEDPVDYVPVLEDTVRYLFGSSPYRVGKNSIRRGRCTRENWLFQPSRNLA